VDPFGIMAPKKEPAVLQKLKEQLKSKNLELTVETLKDIKENDPLLYKNIGSSLDYCMDADAKKDFKMVRHDPEERLVWITRFCLDWKSGGVTGTASHSVSVSTSDTSKWVRVWLTESQLAGPLYLNSASDARLSVAHKKDRLHTTDVGLAMAGIKEYEHWMLREEFARRKKEEHNLTCEAEVDNETGADPPID
jgi:hypothetical protein